MGWTSSLFGGGRNVDPETDGNNFGFVAAGSRAGAGDDVLLEDLEEDRTDLLRIILYGAFLAFYKIELLGQRGCQGVSFESIALGFGEFKTAHRNYHTAGARSMHVCALPLVKSTSPPAE